jgi:hypothetical protein
MKADPLAARCRRLATGEGDAHDSAWLAVIARGFGNGLTPAAAIAAATREERDRRLFLLWREHYPQLPMTRAATAIVTDLLRYQASGWRHDRAERACPHPAGSLRANLWQLLALGCRIPQSRQVFEIFRSEMQSDRDETA